MPNRPKASDWNRYDEVADSGIRGWNAMQRLPKLMSDLIDWMKEFNLGFCSESDMPEWTSKGWVPLRAEHFDVGEFNSSVGLRFGLTDVDGVIRYRENILMIMPKDFRKRLIKRRNDNFESYYAKTMADKNYVVPEDPRAQEILDTYAEAKFEEHVVAPSSNVSPGTLEKKKPGRPPKK